MIITVSRSGGFAGLTEQLGVVNTRELNSEVAQRIERIVKDTNFFRLPPYFPEDAVGADMFVYDITVQASSKKQHTVHAMLDVVEAESSRETSQFRELIQLVTQQT